ncbi:MAG: PP2C family protein-serine/threonine phosphatase [Phycisphaerales bacterium]|jgi:sigma-B regulation protein RsbU (phosphoserine phosphatase)
MTFKRDWREQLAIVDALMRDVSRQTDPQELVKMYAEGVQKLSSRDRIVSVSRRGHTHPEFRVTRSSTWSHAIDPWRERGKLPLLRGGLLCDLLYANEPRVVLDLNPDPADPAYEYLKDMRALVTLPQYEDGEALNMAVMLYSDPAKVDPETYPNAVWQANLFGRSTANMVLRRDLRDAYDALDREMRAVGEIQRSLLPASLPTIPGVELAASYETSQRAGGDYYDLFPMGGDRWGLFIADVSGHGTPAAVMMAITHAVAHARPGEPAPPDVMLTYLNHALSSRYTGDTGAFVTAFYAVLDPKGRTLTYANAGHPPPRIYLPGISAPLDGDAGLPLGVLAEETYALNEVALMPGSQLLLFTDGITEAFSQGGEMFGMDRLDELGRRHVGSAKDLVAAISEALKKFAGEGHPSDDRTLLAAALLAGH